MAWASLSPAPGGLIFRSSYDEALVEAMRSEIPSSAKKWQGATKVWIIDPAYAGVLARIVEIHLGVLLRIPLTTNPVQDTLAFELHYVGQVKDRGGESMATGLLANGDWGLLFPEKVLRTWFADDALPTVAQTLYSVLAVRPDASEQEIKSAFRRLAMHTHPDRNHEPTAHEDFKRLNHAYEVLSDPIKRRKYAVGISVEADARLTAAKEARYEAARPYRPPLRCGLILVTGTASVGRFVVSEVHSWVDLVDRFGRTMVTSFPKDSDKLIVEWR